MARTPLNEHCSAVILNKLPKKLRDPGKFLIPCDFPRMDECLALADLGASINLMPLSVWKKLSLPELTPTCMTLELADRSISLIDRYHEDVDVKTGRALIDVYEGELTLRVGKEAVTFNLGQTSRYSSNHDDMTARPYQTFMKWLVRVFSKKFLVSSMVIASGQSHSLYDPDQLKVCKAKTDKSSIDEPPTESNSDKSSIDEPPEVELKDLPPHLEYAFLEGDDKFPVIIAKDLSVEEKAALIKILMEEDYKPAVQHQRWMNPKIHDVIKKEVEKLLDTRLIYLISDSPWVSPVHCVPKKDGFTVVENDENELIPTRLVTGWRVSIDYRKLNEATRKDHFPLPFMDQMLERLAGNEYYCFLELLSNSHRS
ncbi:reverse transcriptase domain-containing protein [Tanacetum coccineum]